LESDAIVVVVFGDGGVVAWDGHWLDCGKDEHEACDSWVLAKCSVLEFAILHRLAQSQFARCGKAFAMVVDSWILCIVVWVLGVWGLATAIPSGVSG
jgi:hypothetical protein